MGVEKVERERGSREGSASRDGVLLEKECE